MIEVGQEYFYIYDDSIIVCIHSVDGGVYFRYISPDIIADTETHEWGGGNFEDMHKPITKLHKLLRGIE